MAFENLKRESDGKFYYSKEREILKYFFLDMRNNHAKEYKKSIWI